MDGSLFAELLARLAWVTGALSTLVLLLLFLFVLICCVQVLPLFVWWILGLGGSLSAYLIYPRNGDWTPLLETTFWMSLCGGVAGWIGIAFRSSYARRRSAASGDPFDRFGEVLFAEGDASVTREPRNPIDVILDLERQRIRRGYKPGWLYFQCENAPELLEALQQLRAAGRIEQPESEHREKRKDPSAQTRPAPFDPYSVLGVTHHATHSEIRAAYKQQMFQYHPDRVSHLGPALKEVAEAQTRAIQRAYEMLKDGVR